MSKKIAIFPNINKDEDFCKINKVVGALKNFDSTVLIEEKYSCCNIDKNVSCVSEKQLLNEADFAIVLGGDGTLLSVARTVAPYNIPILGINIGYLGFLSELEKNDLEGFEHLFSGEFEIDTRIMLNVEIRNESKVLSEFLALNDAVITRGSYSRIINLKLYADDKFVDNYPADGIVIATPTGSTAYSLSAGGPIIDPNMSVVMATPICPHSLHSRTMIFPDNKIIKVEIENKKENNTAITIDGQIWENILENQFVNIKKSDYTTKLIRIKNRNFYDVLRKKLSNNY